MSKLKRIIILLRLILSKFSMVRLLFYTYHLEIDDNSKNILIGNKEHSYHIR